MMFQGALWLVVSASFLLLVITGAWDHCLTARPRAFAIIVSPYVPESQSRVDYFNESLISDIYVYENVILLNGQFFIAGDFVNLTGSYRESHTSTGVPWKPTVLGSFQEKLPSRVSPGLSILYAPFFPANVGHAILDSIYQIFVSLVRLGWDAKDYHSFVTSLRSASQ
jgi:hypothetical protein